MGDLYAGGRSWPATSTATAGSTWPSRASTWHGDGVLPCCWATATAPSRLAEITSPGQVADVDRRPATSTATASSTWPSPTNRLRTIGSSARSRRPAGQRRRDLPAARAVVSPSGTSPVALVAGDFNGDGKLDLAVADEATGNDCLDPARATATARSSPPSTVATRCGTDIRRRSWPGDFNGDGKLDLAVARRQRASAVDVVDPAGQRRRHVPAADHLRRRDRQPVCHGRGRLQRRRQPRPGRRRDRRVRQRRRRSCWATATARSSPTATVRRRARSDGRWPRRLQRRRPGSTWPSPTPDRRRLGPAGQRRRHVRRRRASSPRPPTPRPWWPTSTATAPTTCWSSTAAGDILYRQGHPRQPGTFEPPVIVNPGFPSRDIAWVPDTPDGPAAGQRRRPGRRRLALCLPRRRLRPGRIARRPAGCRRRSSRPTSTATAGTTWSSATPATAPCRSIFNNGLGAASSDRDLDDPFLPAVTLPVGPGISDVQAVDTTRRRPARPGRHQQADRPGERPAQPRRRPLRGPRRPIAPGPACPRSIPAARPRSPAWRRRPASPPGRSRRAARPTW